MPSCSVTLHFPFRIEGREHVAELETSFIRKENTVTFALPFSALVAVNSRQTYTVHYSKMGQSKGRTSVCIDFKSINDAISFAQEKDVYLSYLAPKALVPVDEELERASAE